MNENKLWKIHIFLLDNILFILLISFIVSLVAVNIPTVMGKDTFRQAEKFEITTTKVLDHDLGHYVIEIDGQKQVREQGKRLITTGDDAYIVLFEGNTFGIHTDEATAKSDVEFIVVFLDLIISALISIIAALVVLLFVALTAYTIEQYTDKLERTKVNA